MADETQRFIATWAEAMSLPQAPATFHREVLVLEDGIEYWLPVQDVVADAMIRELEPGQAIEIFAVYAGQSLLDHVFLVNEFMTAGKPPAEGRRRFRRISLGELGKKKGCGLDSRSWWWGPGDVAPVANSPTELLSVLSVTHPLSRMIASRVHRDSSPVEFLERQSVLEGLTRCVKNDAYGLSRGEAPLVAAIYTRKSTDESLLVGAEPGHRFPGGSLPAALVDGAGAGALAPLVRVVQPESRSPSPAHRCSSPVELFELPHVISNAARKVCLLGFSEFLKPCRAPRGGGRHGTVALRIVGAAAVRAVLTDQPGGGGMSRRTSRVSGPGSAGRGGIGR
jgi:hypothetical protein